MTFKAILAPLVLWGLGAAAQYTATPTGAGPFPAVVMLPGCGDDSQLTQRADELAGNGMVAFVADAAADLTCAAASSQAVIQTAVDTAKALPDVDPQNIVVYGYCGTGLAAIEFAFSGNGNGTAAAVSFDGCAAPGVEIGEETAAVALLHFGADSDSHEDILEVEAALDSVNATWESTRYSGAGRGFGLVGGDAYNDWADARAWQSASVLLTEVFYPQDAIVLVSPPEDTPSVTDVAYSDGDVELSGFLGLPDSLCLEAGKLPAVVVVPAWSGLRDTHERKRVQMLADLGLVAFAADIYGADKHDLQTVAEKMEQSAYYSGNPDVLAGRLQAAIDVVVSQAEVDADRLAVMGYCFGGTAVLSFAATGGDQAVGVVAFHAGMSTRQPIGDVAVAPRLLVLSGGEDPSATDTQIGTLVEELQAVQADWELTRYSGTLHAFSDWGGSDYNERADMRSWNSMKDFYSRIFNYTLLDADACVPVAEATEILAVPDVY